MGCNMKIFDFNVYYVISFFLFIFVIYIFLEPDLDDWEVEEYSDTILTFLFYIRKVEIQFYSSSYSNLKTDSRDVIRFQTERLIKILNKYYKVHKTFKEEEIKRLIQNSQLVINKDHWSNDTLLPDVEIKEESNGFQVYLKAYDKTSNLSKTYFKMIFFTK